MTHEGMGRLAEAGTVATAVACGLAGGVFFAFSSFVMPSLRRLPDAQGIAAMQEINRQAVTPVFMTALFGAAGLCVAVGGWALRNRGLPAAPWVLAGAATYLVGAIGVTAARNVPLNDALAALDPAGAGAAGEWHGYVRDWVRWNHLRAAAGAGSAALMAIGLRAG